MKKRGKDAPLDKYLEYKWWIIRNKSVQGKPYQLKILEPNTKNGNLMGYILSFSYSASKVLDKTFIKFTCTGGTFRYLWVNMVPANNDPIFAEHCKTPAVLTRYLKTIMANATPPETVISTPVFLEGLNLSSKVSKEDMNKKDTTSKDKSKAKSTSKSTTEDSEEENVNDDKEEDSKLDLDDEFADTPEVHGSGRDDDVEEVPAQDKISKRKSSSSSTSSDKQPQHSGKNQVEKTDKNSDKQPSGKNTIPRKDSSQPSSSSGTSAAKKPKSPAVKSNEIHKPPKNNINKQKDKESTTPNVKSKPPPTRPKRPISETDSDDDNETDPPPLKDDDPDSEGEDDNFPDDDNVSRTSGDTTRMLFEKAANDSYEGPDLPDNNSWKEGLNDLGMKFMEMREKYFLGTYVFDPTKIESPPENLRVRGIDPNHVRNLFQRILSNPRAVVAKLLYNLKQPYQNKKDFSFDDVYSRGIYPVGGSHTTEAYKQLHNEYPRNPLFRPTAELYNGLPTTWVYRLGNQHNEDVEFHKRRTLLDKVQLVRAIWDADGRPDAGSYDDDEDAPENTKKRRKGNIPEWKRRSLEALGIWEPNTSHYKSFAELFKVATAPNDLWFIYLAMLTGSYFAHGRKTKRRDNNGSEDESVEDESDGDLSEKVTITSTDDSGKVTEEVITARENMLRSGKRARGKPIENQAAFRSFIKISVSEAIRVGTAFINGQMTLKKIDLEAARIKVIARIRKAFVDNIGLASWAEACAKYGSATSDQVMLQWFDVFQRAEETAKANKHRKIVIPEQFTEWCQKMKTNIRKAQQIRKQHSIILQRDDATATIFRGSTDLLTSLIGSCIEAALVFIDPPRLDAQDQFTVDNYLQLFSSIESINKRPACLYVLFADVMQLPEIRSRIIAIFGTNKVTVRHGAYMDVFGNLAPKSWHNPCWGILYVWKGKPTEFDPKVVSSTDASLSFATTESVLHYRDPLGQIVDSSEISRAYATWLIERHTRPGDLVLDICAGSGALAATAFRHGRTVIAIDNDDKKYVAIAARLRALVDINEVADDEEPATTSESTLADTKNSTPKPKSSEEHSTQDLPSCVVCGQTIESPTKQSACATCGISLHYQCAQLDKSLPFCSEKCKDGPTEGSSRESESQDNTQEYVDILNHMGDSSQS